MVAVFYYLTKDTAMDGGDKGHVIEKIEVVNMMNTSISSIWRMDIAVSAQCVFNANIFCGMLTVRFY